MIILFSNSNPKIPKQSIFGPKLKKFYLAPGFAVAKTNSAALISIMTIEF